MPLFGGKSLWRPPHVCLLVPPRQGRGALEAGELMPSCDRRVLKTSAAAGLVLSYATAGRAKRESKRPKPTFVCTIFRWEEDEEQKRDESFAKRRVEIIIWNSKYVRSKSGFHYMNSNMELFSQTCPAFLLFVHGVPAFRAGCRIQEQLAANWKNTDTKT